MGSNVIGLNWFAQTGKSRLNVRMQIIGAFIDDDDDDDNDDDDARISQATRQTGRLDKQAHGEALL